MAKNNKNTPVKIKLATSIPEGYEKVLESLLGKIKASQTRAMVSVNRELIEVYRNIGKTIYDQQQTAEWGESVVEQLAEDLRNSFPGMKGFSSRNLWRIYTSLTEKMNN